MNIDQCLIERVRSVASFCGSVAEAKKMLDEALLDEVRQIWKEQWIKLANTEAIVQAPLCTDVSRAQEKYLAAPIDSEAGLIWKDRMLGLVQYSDVARRRISAVEFGSEIQRIWGRKLDELLIAEAVAGAPQCINPGVAKEMYQQVRNSSNEACRIWTEREWELREPRIAKKAAACTDIDVAKSKVSENDTQRSLWARRVAELLCAEVITGKAQQCIDIDFAKNRYFMCECNFSYFSSSLKITREAWFVRWTELANAEAAHAVACTDVTEAEKHYFGFPLRSWERNASQPEGTAVAVWRKRWLELVEQCNDIDFCWKRCENEPGCNCHGSESGKVWQRRWQQLRQVKSLAEAARCVNVNFAKTKTDNSSDPSIKSIWQRRWLELELAQANSDAIQCVDADIAREKYHEANCSEAKRVWGVRFTELACPA